jgi:CheY-like chemotaxis protein
MALKQDVCRAPARPIKVITEFFQDMTLKEIKILLVEDNSDHALLAQMAISRLDMNINLTVCANGQDALEMMDTHGFSPDIALIDIELMNGLDGFDVAMQIREKPHLNHTDIIYFTGYENPEYEVLANKTGAFDYILKHEDMSITVTRLKKSIGKWSERRRAGSN